MKRFSKFLFLVIILFGSNKVYAQNKPAKVVTTCANQTLTVNSQQLLTIAPDGTLCINASITLNGVTISVAANSSVTATGMSVPGFATNIGVSSSGLTTELTGTNVGGKVALDVNSVSPLPAGTAVIGHVINDASTAVIGHVINDASSAVIGHVITDSGSVTNATLSAETTKVIGTINISASQTVGLVAGTAVIGHVIVDSGGGGGTQYNQGDVSTATDTGTIALAYRNDTPSVQTGVANGDRIVLSTNNVGALWAAINGNVTAVSGTAGNFLASVNIRDASGTAFSATNPVPTRPTDGVAFVNDAPIGSALSSNPIPIACHRETSPTTIGDTQAGVPECDTTQHLIIVGTGTFVTQATLAAETTKVIGTINLSAAQTLANVTTLGTITNALPTGTNYLGGVRPWADGTLKSGAVTTAMTGTTSTSVVAGLASNYYYATSCTTSNSSLTVSTDINLQDGSGGTVIHVLPSPAASVATTGGGGGHFSFPTPLKVPTIGNGLFAANVTTGSSTKISCNGYYSTTTF